MSNLYQVLGLDASASEDQIRKAYRKAALRTHPDRLPPSTSAADRERSTEEFRNARTNHLSASRPSNRPLSFQISNAYEILSDPTKRQEYDRHGVWPPPPDHSPYPEPPPFNNRTRPYDSWDARGPQPQFPPSFAEYHQPHLTDPFRIFEAFFGSSAARAFHVPFDDPYDDFRNPLHPNLPPPFVRMGFGVGPSRGFGEDFFNDSFGHSFGGGSRGPSVRVYSSSSTHTQSSSPGQGGWVSESHSTTTVNGVTESVWRRKDANGNEYVTRKYADGRERRTINGVEEDIDLDRNLGYRPPPPPLPPHHSRHHRAESSRRKRGDLPPVVPPPPPPSYHSEPSPIHAPHREGDSSPYIPPPPGTYPTDYHDERRYYQTGYSDRGRKHNSWWPWNRR
ncbi:hypothetical protein OF83DRAFT_1102671 [Amylostereum chailletii]|nr:hypothetical protein OF83DRAFT_1102671 [Amylostereum chailletii]